VNNTLVTTDLIGQNGLQDMSCRFMTAQEAKPTP
jgi:hypothetical protein